ncbi:mitochondrial ribosomal protein subunit S18 [Mycena vitilis]|nr:mitochondrial ribosomal protein subunit S18 [Mycena vitilis]
MFALPRAPLRLAMRVASLRPSVGFSTQPAIPHIPAFREDTTFSGFSGMLTAVHEANPDASPDVSSPPLSNPFAQPVLDTDHKVHKAIPAHRLHCHSTKTNTINTFTDPDGNVLAWFSGGSCGFRKRNRSSYEAGYQCAVRMFEKIEAMAAEQQDPEKPPWKVDLFCKGFGQGREALFKALMTAQGDGLRNRVSSLTDRSPIRIGGTRSKKQKRR